MKKKCLYCLKPIVAIGTSRENGANHNDWNSRKYHKKCFKELQWDKIRQDYDAKNN